MKHISILIGMLLAMTNNLWSMDHDQPEDNGEPIESLLKRKAKLELIRSELTNKLLNNEVEKRKAIQRRMQREKEKVRAQQRDHEGHPFSGFLQTVGFCAIACCIWSAACGQGINMQKTELETTWPMPFSMVNDISGPPIYSSQIQPIDDMQKSMDKKMKKE